MSSPINLLNNWLAEEAQSGAINPRQAVLATCAKDAIPHARVVAIREIQQNALLFFTQKATRKVRELSENPIATMTFWFEILQREVIIEGTVTPLLEAENLEYWKTYPRQAKIRFHSYAPTSSQPITSKAVLDERKKQIENDYHNKEVPLSPDYLGFKLIPKKMIFYAYRTDELSDVFEYRNNNDSWVMQWLSP